MNKNVSRLRGEHEIYCCGARVRISEKGVKVLTKPTLEYCPLHEALYGTKKIDVETVRKTVKKKISGYGFCCANRIFDAEPVVAYGASEMMRTWLDKGLIDCAVVVCEGAGTVITANGELVQSIGARLTGIVKTSPIREIIERIEADGGVILDKSKARIDQAEGAKRAIDLGSRRIAVSVAGFQAKAVSEIRLLEASAKANVLVFSVCNTCIGETQVKHIAKADIACAGASKILRQRIGTKALMQLGVTIPVFALTERGKRLILAYLTQFKDKLVIFKTNQSPYKAKDRGPKLKAMNKPKRLSA
jgi:putative methanogenesis marker protein 8